MFESHLSASESVLAFPTLLISQAETTTAETAKTPEAKPQFAQTEYTLGYALVTAFVLLGMLLVCVPRSRKKDFPNPKRDELEKKEKQKQKDKQKAGAQAKKTAAKKQQLAKQKAKKK